MGKEMTEMKTLMKRLLKCCFILLLAATLALPPQTNVKAATSTAATIIYPAKFYVDIDEGYVNIRKKPSTSSKVVGTAPKGKVIKVLYQYNANWYAVKYKSRIRYMSAQYLTPKVNVQNKDTSVAGTYYVNNVYGYLNVRDVPDTSNNSKIVYTFKQGKKVKVLYAVDSDWVAIKYKSKTYFVFFSYISKTKP